MGRTCRDVLRLEKTLSLTLTLTLTLSRVQEREHLLGAAKGQVEG